MITASPIFRSAEGRTQKVYGQLNFTGSYPTGGDAFPPLAVGSKNTPSFVTAYGANAIYQFGHNPFTNKLVLRKIQNGQELVAGAYPPDVATDTVMFMAVYTKF